MAVFKDNWNGYEGKKWRVQIRYVDWQGKKREHNKRGLATKKEALEYEREFLAKKSRDVNMAFGTFIDQYLEDLKPQIKLNTYHTKVHIINTHIRPYFADKSLSEISSTDILQ